MKRCVVFFVLFFPAVCGTVHAASYTDWAGYPALFSIIDIAVYEGDVYCATSGGMFRYDPESNEYTLYYKNKGLISNDILCIGATSDALFLGFKEDGLWRFDPRTEVFEQILFPEYHIKTSSNPNGIAIHDIYARSDSVLFIGHENGLDMLNLFTEELRTYSNLGAEISENKPVNHVQIFDGKIRACTADGLAVADENDPFLEFPENWKNYTYKTGSQVYGITSVLPVTETGADEADIYVGTNRGNLLIIDRESDTLSPTASTPNVSVSSFAGAFGEYWAASPEGLMTKQVKLWRLYDGAYMNLTALAAGEGDKLWVGTEFDGLQCFTADGYIEIPQPSGLMNLTFYDIDVGQDGTVWCATTYRDTNQQSSFQCLYDDAWVEYDHSVWNPTNFVVSTIVDGDGHVWTTTWGKGVWIIEDDGTPSVLDDTFIHVDENKEIFKPTINNYFVVCSDITTDKHGNIWVANMQVDPPEHQVEAIPSSGAVVVNSYPVTNYQHYSPAEDNLPTAVIFVIETDDDNWVWLGTYNKGVIGIYTGEDPYDKTDTVVKNLSLTDDILSQRINAISVDKDGFVWVGSQAGLNRITKENGYVLSVEIMNDLLDSSFRDVKAIAVDRYNNKWIGTTGGLVKISAENVTETTYTTSNSGLFSDTILSLKYDDSTDMLWIGTGAGLNRFDTMGGVTDTGDPGVRVYPNPFEIWGYDSRATFPNLKSGSSLKIYSFSGDLVREIAAEETNGQFAAIWDGTNFGGTYVGSGVYFFTGEDEHERKFRDKMVVIRR